MPFKFFTIPIRDGGDAEGELNRFLQSHKALTVDRRWVEQGADSFWSICVDYLTGSVAGPPASAPARRGKVDYKEVLSPQEFAIFAKLRELRKELAQEDSVPVYTIFTDEQLAQMAQGNVTDKASLEKVDGVGTARVEKYGARVLELLSRPQTTEDGGNGAV